MGELLQSLLTFVLLYKYVAVFALTLLSAVGVPIPSGTIVIAAFYFATQGYMEAAWIFVANAAGNILGDLLTFVAVRRYGPRIRQTRIGRLLNASSVRTIESKIAAHPISTVFFTRLMTAVTPFANVLAGLSAMSLRAFAPTAIVGELTLTALYFVYGTFFGNEISYILQVVGLAGTLALVLAGLVALLLWKRARRMRLAKLVQ